MSRAWEAIRRRSQEDSLSLGLRRVGIVVREARPRRLRLRAAIQRSTLESWISRSVASIP